MVEKAHGASIPELETCINPDPKARTHRTRALDTESLSNRKHNQPETRQIPSEVSGPKAT